MHNGNQQDINPVKTEKFTQPELIAMVEEYPYYSPAQFWLLSDYKKNLHPSFDKQALITGLFFNSSKWLNWQLSVQNKTADSYSSLSKPDSSTIASADNKIENIQLIDKKNEQSIAFEPLHMVDYFASQGIKISEEALTNDKLGTQLKSFTEWLKSMKKVHIEKIAEVDEHTEKIIRHIAESSNASTGVITEAMAEVLVKQGKVEQAIEMYNKLSLNYPSRSAYFAGKIKSLKSV